MGLIQSNPQHLNAFYADDELSAPLRSTLKDVEHLFIRPQRFKIEEGDQAGAGGFGEVMLATLDKSSRNSRKVAVKQLRAVGTKGDRKRLAIRLARELKIWATLQHPNILGLLGYYLSENYEIAQLISVYLVNGNVSQYLNQHRPDIATRLKFIQDITAGLQYLHAFNPPICHGDLKPANVLIGDEIEAIICDFGVASFVNQAAGPSGLTTTRALKGSMRYMSPELLLEGEVKQTLPSDIWAWACTTYYEILTDIEPYSEVKTNGAIIAEVVQRKVPGSTQVLLSRFPQDETWPTKLSEVINECWNFDSSKRPSVTTLIGAIKYVSTPPPSSASGVGPVWAGGQSQTTLPSVPQPAAIEPTRPDKGLETDVESPPRKSADERATMSDGAATTGGGLKDLKRRISTRKAVMESGNSLLSAESEERALTPPSSIITSPSLKGSDFCGSLSRRKRNSDEGTANGSPSSKTKGERLSFFGRTLGKGRKPVPSEYSDTLPTAKPTALDQIGQPDHSGWMRKRGEIFKAWQLRYFVIKGRHLYYVKTLNETKIKGSINITGYKIFADKNVDPGRYGFRIVHDTEKPHYFSSVERTVVQEWMKALIKANIGRDYSRPVVSSCNPSTIPLSVAQTMNPPPRPPSPTVRAAIQRAMHRENANRFRDAFVLMGLSDEPDSTDKARLDQVSRAPPVGDAVDAPPRPSRELRRVPGVRALDAARDSSNSASDMELISWINTNLASNVPPATDLSTSLASGLILYRLAESIKGLPTDVPDSVFDIDGPDGMFKLFDFMLDYDVRIGNVSINDVRLGNKEKITQLVKSLKSWQEKREGLVKGMSKQPSTAGPWLAVG